MPHLVPGDGRCWFSGYDDKTFPTFSSCFPSNLHPACPDETMHDAICCPAFRCLPHLLQVMHSSCPEKSAHCAMQFTMYGSTHLPMVLPTFYIVSYLVTYLVPYHSVGVPWRCIIPCVVPCGAPCVVPCAVPCIIPCVIPCVVPCGVPRTAPHLRERAGAPPGHLPD